MQELYYVSDISRQSYNKGSRGVFLEADDTIVLQPSHKSGQIVVTPKQLWVVSFIKRPMD